jgi:signal transduction histidine kinase
MLAHDAHEAQVVRIDAARACGADDSSERSARAAERITALGEMTRGIAHDFRNVLCMLTSGLNVAEASTDDPDKLKLAFAAMQDGIARGLRVTNRLLDFAHQQELKPGSDDINSLLSAQKTFLDYGAGPGIQIVLDLAPALPTCLVDPPQLNAAILNLIVNARDAMPGGGVIRISTALAHPPRGHGRPYVRLRVRDDGAGMPDEVVARIFDPFFTTKGNGGTGLGVPQVQASMRQVQGFVTVRSALGRGTAFDLFFPVQPDESSPAAEAAQALDQWADEGGAVGRPSVKVSRS